MATSSELVVECKKHLGESKLYTGEDDSLPWCARFLVSCMKDVGMNPPDTWSAKGLYDWCEPISDDEAQEGDLVCFNFDGRENTSWFDHIGIVLWFDHGNNTYKTIEGNSGSNYSVGCYAYDNSEYPPKTYFCRPTYENEIGGNDTMAVEDFDEMWCNHSFNYPPLQGKWSATPGNVLLHILGMMDDTVSKIDMVSQRLSDIESKIDSIS